MWKQTPFVNREKELVFLKNTFDSDRAEFIVIYGRRRIGKTELIKESIKDRKAVYFFVEQALEEENLNSFKEIIAKTVNNPLIAKSNLTWEEVFEQITNEDKLIIVLDEFPNLILENKALLSKFQKMWDGLLKNTTIKLIVCGSSISMMENYLLDIKSPLYGRRTGQIFLEPLKASHILKFGALSFEESIRVYGITDGIPEYIKEVCYRLEHGEDLEEVFQQNKTLFNEVEILIKSELRDPTRYFKILKAIAFGSTKFGEIVNFTDFSAPTVSKYLSNLVNLHVIEELYPVLSDKERKRNRKYALSDNYFKFYFRFIYPNKSELISTGRITDFDIGYNQYLGKIFEDVSREFLDDKNKDKTKSLPFEFTKIGCWWHRDKEIDLVALNDGSKEILFVECKWKTLSLADCRRILGKLNEKSTFVQWNMGIRKEYFGLIAKKIEGKQRLRDEGFIVYDLDDF